MPLLRHVSPVAVIALALLCGRSDALATQEGAALPAGPFHPTVEVPGLDGVSRVESRAPVPPIQPGPITASTRQPAGALSGRIVFTSAGHGWAWGSSGWALGRPLLNSMVEDYGNLDQMTMFAFYCFNAGATVVPLRPVGHQTNEVVLDNTSPQVTWEGGWADSTSGVYYGAAGAVPYRYATLAATETATATYAPTIPVAGLYPVYCWALSGGNRTNQLYRINHTGGQTLVRVPHHMVGNGWVYLGSYWFKAGRNAAEGSVVISNLAEGEPGASVVIADAIRFGNGMGDVDRGGGVSGYPREEECSRYWVQRSLGQGQSDTIYDNPSLVDSDDNVRAPTKMAVEMNRESAGSMYKRVFVSFHSNAGGGRGVLGLYNNPALSPNVETNSNTLNQRRLAYLLGAEINNDLVGIGTPSLEVAWYNRGTDVIFARSDYAFGEINNNTIQGEFDATIVEVAFHDNLSDAKLMRDPKARSWVARAACQGLVRYFNEFDAGPLAFAPEPPVNVRAQAAPNGVMVSWSAPVAQGGAGAPTGYVVYHSSDGRGFGNPETVGGGSTLSLLLTNLTGAGDSYFRVAAFNAGGESFPSEVVGVRRPVNPLASRVLLVNGFTRFDRTLDLRQTPTARVYRAPGHDGNSGTMDRVMPGRVNAFDYVVPHGKAIAAAGLMSFDSCQVQAVTNGTVDLGQYDIVVWACGNQSAAERTFNSAAQAKVGTFLAGGGRLFVSGAEVAWDLDRTSGPSAADRDFLHSRLHVALNGDTNNDSNVYNLLPAGGSFFASAGGAVVDDGSKGFYWVGYPDAVTAVGAGAVPAVLYSGYSGGAAAVCYDGEESGGRVVFMGFPFEALVSESARTNYMAAALRFLSRAARVEVVSVLPDTGTRLQLTGEPGLTYSLQSSTNFADWVTFTNVVNASGQLETGDPSIPVARKFYRATVAR